MTSKMNKSSYKELVEQDIEWLLKQPKTLERSHIEQIVIDSIDFYYQDAVRLELEALRAKLYAAEDEIEELKKRRENADR